MISGQYRDQFHIPKIHDQESVYLCGNSLGLQPKRAAEYVQAELEDWATLGVEGHLHARHPWLPYHEFLTASMARLTGARESEVVVMNSLTVNLHLLLASFYRPTRDRYKILIESDAFPSDRYAVASQAAWHGLNAEDVIIQWRPDPGQHLLDIGSLEDILKSEGDQIAVILLGGVNYYTGQYFDLGRITQLAHEYDILMGVDLAHAIGNVDLQLHDWDVDFAAWCSYKYLNSGPGSIAGIFIHDRLGQDLSVPRLSGWWGHNKETRFGMRDDFDPLPGAEGWQLSNPPILPLATMRASMELFDAAGIANLRLAAMPLVQEIYDAVSGKKGIDIITPADPMQRGGQLSLLVRDHGRKLFSHLEDHHIIADWREPDVVRIAIAPLYNTLEDAAHLLRAIDEFPY